MQDFSRLRFQKDFVQRKKKPSFLFTLKIYAVFLTTLDFNKENKNAEKIQFVNLFHNLIFIQLKVKQFFVELRQKFTTKNHFQSHWTNHGRESVI